MEIYRWNYHRFDRCNPYLTSRFNGTFANPCREIFGIDRIIPICIEVMALMCAVVDTSNAAFTDYFISIIERSAETVIQITALASTCKT
jgi:hypothetical protein